MALCSAGLIAEAAYWGLPGQVPFKLYLLAAAVGPPFLIVGIALSIFGRSRLYHTMADTPEHGELVHNPNAELKGMKWFGSFFVLLGLIFSCVQVAMALNL